LLLSNLKGLAKKPVTASAMVTKVKAKAESLKAARAARATVLVTKNL
jgi:hypothetical protein